MFKKQVCLYQGDYMINCNEIENNNGKMDHVNSTNIDQYLDIEANKKNIACLGKTMSLCNKQHLSNIWGSVYEKFKGAFSGLSQFLALMKAL